MNIDDLLRAGNDILEDVMEAVNENNYSDLGQKIRSRVRDVTSSSSGGAYSGQTDRQPGGTARGRNAAGAGYGQRPGNTGYGQQPQNTGSGQRPQKHGYGQQAQNIGYGQQRTAAGYGSYAGRRSNFLLKRVGKAGTTVRTVFGGLGLLAFGIPLIICLVELILSGGGAMLAGTIIFGLLTAGAGWLLGTGIRGDRLVNRYYAYGRQLGDAEYIDIPMLAERTGIPEKEVRKDLLEMMRRGYLPQAKMDSQQKTLILTEQAYGLYRQAEASRQQRAAEEAAQKKAAEAQQKAAKKGKRDQKDELQQTPEVREILERGNAYIRKVRDVNDMIPDTEEMSTKLYRLEEIMHRIFEQVQKQPASAAGLRRFMDYYLPTTEKLLDAYVELDRQPVSGSNITKTKQEIDDAMDVINDAFENLLNGMFENMAWDISSDISAMKTMMAQDGLTQKKPLFEFDMDPEKQKEPVYVHADSGQEQAGKGR